MASLLDDLRSAIRRLRRAPGSWGDTLRGTVVGVVGNVHHASFDSLPRPTLYWAEAQWPWSAMTLVVRTGGDPARLAPSVVAEIHTLARRRFLMTLLAGSAGTALALTAVGLYGVLGAELRRALAVLGAGVAAGLAGAAAFTRVLDALLFGLSATDPAVFALIVALLAGVGLAASWIPARRATRVDPMVALRVD